MNSYYIFKSQGDIVYSLPAIFELGGGDIITGLPTDQFKALKPLIDYQEIVKLWHEGNNYIPPYSINLEDFRYTQKEGGHLCDTFCQLLNVEANWKDGWLKVPPGEDLGEYSVINITQRYRDKVFNWNKDLRFISENGNIPVLFLGLKEEYLAFAKMYPRHQIRWIKTDNWLEAAQYIKGAKYFSGTQSCCLSIAEGLGRTYRYERSPFFDNVRTGLPRETILNNHTRKIHFALSRIQESYRNFLK